MWPYPRLIGHRGAGRLAPENTLAAMRVAVGYGVRMVEYDVALTRDAVPILLHDQSVERTSNGQGNADELSLLDLAALDFGAWHSAAFAGEPAPTLFSISAYTQANGLCSNIEIKPQPGRETLTGRIVAQTAGTLWQKAAQAPLLSSFSETALQAAADAAPFLPRALLLDGPLPDDWPHRMRALGCMALHLDQTHIEHDTIRAVHDKGYKIAAWTVNDVQRAQRLLHWGCDAIFTDDIHVLPTALQLT